MDTKETMVTRSYNDSYRCLTCTGDRILHAVLEKGRDLMLSISDQHFPAVVPPQDDNCMASVRMSNVGLWSLAVHTIWQICNEWSKELRKHAVSQDQHGALSLLQRALSKKKRITLYFSSGTGLTSEGAAGYSFAMHCILQLSQTKEFREANSSLIRHVIFPQPLIYHIEKPYSRDILGPE